MLFKKNRNKWLVKISAGVCVLALCTFTYLLILSNSNQKNAQASSYTADQVIVAVNRQRISKKLKPLIYNPQLSKAAQNKTNDMSTKSYFSHVSPVDGKKWSDFIKASGYDYVIAGENLANGFDNLGDMVQAWMNSPSHRENILNESVEETGVGVSIGKLDGYPTIFVAQVFGKQAKTIKQAKPAQKTIPNPKVKSSSQSSRKSTTLQSSSTASSKKPSSSSSSQNSTPEKENSIKTTPIGKNLDLPVITT